MKSILIFDLDGCLIDSSDVQKKALFESYAAVVGDNKCPSYEEYIKHTGDSIDNVLKKMGLPEEMAHIYRRVSRNSINMVKVNWELIELIRAYREADFSIAISTGKDHDRAIEILSHSKIQGLFDLVVGADDVLNPKPSPDSVILVLEKLKVEKSQAVMIGDGQNDILCAQRAGIKSILTKWYECNLDITGADYTVYSVSELNKVISKVFNNCVFRFNGTACTPQREGCPLQTGSFNC